MITSFFKRSSSSSETQPAKKQKPTPPSELDTPSKLASEAPSEASPANEVLDGSSMTIDQRERMEFNRERALLKQRFAQMRKNKEKLDYSQVMVPQYIEPSWRKILGKEFEKSYFKGLTTFLKKKSENSKKAIYPPPECAFDCFNSCSFKNVKVVIIGQDPYHQPGQAHGLCFSVQRPVKPPPSLKNIFKEQKNDGVMKFVPQHGCLTSWATQGVLMLNACLTVDHSDANSHKGQGWENFTDAVIKGVNAHKSKVVFLLWGKPAQKKAQCINRMRHFVIESSHPSPLGATKTNAPFIGSRCFSKTNEYLEKNGMTPINWQLPAQ